MAWIFLSCVNLQAVYISAIVEHMRKTELSAHTIQRDIHIPRLSVLLKQDLSML